MKRNEYEKPTMQVVELQQTGMLMTSATIPGTFTEEDASRGIDFEDF
jgi:hypothetical protein